MLIARVFLIMSYMGIFAEFISAIKTVQNPTIFMKNAKEIEK